MHPDAIVYQDDRLLFDLGCCFQLKIGPYNAQQQLLLLLDKATTKLKGNPSMRLYHIIEDFHLSFAYHYFIYT